MSNRKADEVADVVDVAALQRGAGLHAEGKLGEAEEVYRPLLNGPAQQAATAHYLLALVLTDQDNPADALQHYQAAIDLGAASGDLFFRCAELLADLEPSRRGGGVLRSRHGFAA